MPDLCVRIFLIERLDHMQAKNQSNGPKVFPSISSAHLSNFTPHCSITRLLRVKTRWVAKNILHTYSCCGLHLEQPSPSFWAHLVMKALLVLTQQLLFLSLATLNKHVGFTQRAYFVLILPISPEYKLL